MRSVHGRDLEYHERFCYEKAIPFELPKPAKFQIVYFPPESEIAPHHHDTTVEVFVIETGTGIVTVNGEELSVVYGDCLLIEPGDVHSIKTRFGLKLYIFKPIEGEDDMVWDTP